MEHKGASTPPAPSFVATLGTALGPSGRQVSKSPEHGNPPLELPDCKVIQDVGSEGNYFKRTPFSTKAQAADKGWAEHPGAELPLSEPIPPALIPAGKSLLGIKAGLQHKILII